MLPKCFRDLHLSREETNVYRGRWLGAMLPTRCGERESYKNPTSKMKRPVARISPRQIAKDGNRKRRPLLHEVQIRVCHNRTRPHCASSLASFTPFHILTLKADLTPKHCCITVRLRTIFIICKGSGADSGATDCRVIPDIMDHRAAKTDFHRPPYLYTKVVPLDPSPQHIIISFTMANIARFRGEQIPLAAHSHKAIAMRLISRRLADPKLAIEDQSIGAVACMASHEVRNSLFTFPLISYQP